MTTTRQAEKAFKIEEHELQLACLTEDIHDHINESPPESMLVAEDVNTAVSRAESLRTQFRTELHKLKKLYGETFDDDYGGKYSDQLDVIKEYITEVKKQKCQFRIAEANAKLSKENYEYDKNYKTTTFLCTEMSRSIAELSTVFEKSLKVDNDGNNLPDEEISKCKEALPEILLEMERLSTKYTSLFDVMPDNYPNRENVAQHLIKRYEALVAHKTQYVAALDEEVKGREIHKAKSFQQSKLNIKLESYKGYGSSTDIYTFQSAFEKKYLKDTPRYHLPDVLINNHLENPAKDLVRGLEDIDEIWERLHKSYGDPKVLLKMKISEVSAMGNLSKLRDSRALKNALVKLINCMNDLIKLSTKHNITEKLYHGDGIATIYRLMGDARVTRWLSKIEDEDLSEADQWKRLIRFLEKELSVHEQKLLVLGDSPSDPPDKNPQKSGKGAHVGYPDHDRDGFTPTSQEKCSFCDEDSHHVKTNGPNGTKIIQYFACKKFHDLTPAERFRELRSRGLCCQCLYPGATQTSGKHALGKCQKIFACKHRNHQQHTVKKHVLVCQEHATSDENQRLLEEYKQKCIHSQRVQLEEFSKEIKLSLLACSYISKPEPRSEPVQQPNDDVIIKEDAVYILQTIIVESEPFNLFFDNGCSDFVSRKKAVQKLSKKRAILERAGPTSLGGIGDTKAVAAHGEYQIRLALHNGKNAVMSGVCLDKLTVTFPQYPLHGAIKDDIHSAFLTTGEEDINDLSSFPESVGGDTDFIVGVKYNRYQPEKEFSLPSGLAVYRSPFLNIDGSRGVIGGPHAVFTEMNRNFFGFTSIRTYYSEQLMLYKMGYQVNPDVRFLKQSDRSQLAEQLDLNLDFGEERDNSSYVSTKSIKQFEVAENAGSVITHRCPDCRSCPQCRNGEKITFSSIEEELEQKIINQSVTVDLDEGKAVASLPFIRDPQTTLAPNKDKALKVYQSQVRKLNKCDKDKQDVIKSEAKLQQLGFVEYVSDLPPDQKKRIVESEFKHFLPWRAVWNANSISTECRLVFDGSLPTSSTYSINDTLAKGDNQLNKLVEIFIRWFTCVTAYHCDVRKMYNSVSLREEDWIYQLYIWQNDLDPNIIPLLKVIKTLIYGLRPSGNQAEYALRLTAELSKDEYPEIKPIVDRDIYVDDCLSGEATTELAYQRADELDLVLKRGGFHLKGFTFSGKPPLEELSRDGVTINTVGSKWDSEKDVLYFDIKDLNFAPKKRGKKPESDGTIPERLTRRQCCGKVGELFDIVGKVTPITAHMKLDLRQLSLLELDWDDPIPTEFRQAWVDHFKTIQELRDVHFQRCIIPIDAVNLDIQTIDTADASKEVACSAIYARVLRKTSEYSCQLVFSRSKLLPIDITQPRAELAASVLGTHTAEVVKRSFGSKHKSSIKLTDSQIVVHWLNNLKLTHEIWNRNRIIEILRFTKVEDWYYVRTHDMIADLGTRRGATIEDVQQGSDWNSGFEWMRKDLSEFPIYNYDEVVIMMKHTCLFTNQLVPPQSICADSIQQTNDSNTNQNESCGPHVYIIKPETFVTESEKRYNFSKYLYNPNKYTFTRSVRVIAYVRRFIKNYFAYIRSMKVTVVVDALVTSTTDIIPPVVACESVTSETNDLPSIDDMEPLGDDEMKAAANYYFRKATLELKHFTHAAQYKKISVEKDSILYFKGRILPSQTIQSVIPLTETMKDLTNMNFCVPLVDKFSPIGFAIANDIHWNHKVANHTGVETVFRYVAESCYIIDGRDIVRMIGKSCQRCRYLRKRSLEVAMGPVSNYLTIAPAFYISQVDLAGPFSSYSPHNKRTTVKVWFAIFCCVTTSTIDMRVMEDYSAPAFVEAFIRMSCHVGYPKFLLADQGSQVVSACETMKLSFTDIKNRLHREVSVDFDTCPVGGHNMHGKVERKIRDVRASLEKSVHNERFSILQWETLLCEISNSINDMPIGYTNYSNDLESIGLLTPNRLKLGRNNERSPAEPLIVTGKCTKFLQENERILKSWFEHWLISYIPKLMHHPKWFRSDVELAIGDVVLFLKNESEISSTYQYGIIDSVVRSKDNVIRTVNVRYRNHSENVDRITKRAVRTLVLIHHVDDIDVAKELGVIATIADAKRRLEVIG